VRHDVTGFLRQAGALELHGDVRDVKILLELGANRPLDFFAFIHMHVRNARVARERHHIRANRPNMNVVDFLDAFDAQDGMRHGLELNPFRQTLQQDVAGLLQTPVRIEQLRADRAGQWLVLIRRDNVEHLILIGGPTDVVVEMNIVRATPVAPLARTVRPDEVGSEAPLAPGTEPGAEIGRSEPKMPRVERTDPQYVEMAKKLEAAMTKPAETEAPTPKVEPRPAAAAAPVEPRLTAPAPVAPVQPEPRLAAPEPIAAPRAPERIEPRPVAPQPAPAPEVAAQPKGSDPFVSLEEEMASLLRPGARPQ